MLYIIYYIYYKVLKIQISSNHTEPTLEMNRSWFIIIATPSFKTIDFVSYALKVNVNGVMCVMSILGHQAHLKFCKLA